jgi:putative transposase
VKGRKRHLLVDTLGLIWGLVVHAGDVQDRDGAKLLLQRVRGHLSRLKLIWADGGYAGQLIGWVQQTCHWALEIVKRSDGAKHFAVLPKRWIVERTFAWFGWYRRLSKDYEQLTENSEAMILVCMIHRMLRHLKPPELAAGWET